MKSILNYLFTNSLNSKSQVIDLLHVACERNFISKDDVPIIEAVLNISNLQASDIMVPRREMDIININDNINDIMDLIVNKKHSRFPVIDGNLSNVLGILHSKDMLNYLRNPQTFDIRSILRDAYFVPEIKNLSILLYEMRVRQNHMALIVDEFTNIIGMVTLEMIIEQIVGDIEDEHDNIDEERNVLLLKHNTYRIKGRCKLSHLNSIAKTSWFDDTVETVSGFIIKRMGRTPINDERIEFDNVVIEIISADSRRINLLQLKVL